MQSFKTFFIPAAIACASFALAQGQQGQDQTRQQQGQQGGAQQDQTGQSSTGQSSQRGQTNQTDRSESKASTSTANRLTAQETRFVQEALESGRHEVEVARMAQTQSSDSKIKSLAQKIADDHAKANDRLEEIARKNGVAITGEASRSNGQTTSTGNTGQRTNGQSTSTRSQTETQRDRGATADAKNGRNGAPGAERRDPSGLRGSEFDRAFAQQMVQDHQQAIEKFETAQKEATNAELKTFISSTLPTLREHLDRSREAERN